MGLKLGCSGALRNCISVSPEEEHAVVTPVFMSVFVCGWGRKWWAGSLLNSQMAPLVFYIFSSVVTVMCSNRSAAHLPTRQRHTSVPTTKSPQYGAQRLCDGRFLWLGKKWEWNQHLMTLSSNQGKLVVFSEQPAGCRCAGPVTSLPQWHSHYYSHFMGCSKHYYSKDNFWTRCVKISTSKPHVRIQLGSRQSYISMMTSTGSVNPSNCVRGQRSVIDHLAYENMLCAALSQGHH